MPGSAKHRANIPSNSEANIPWENKFHTHLSFLDSFQRTDGDIPARGVVVAEYLKRFGEE